MKSKMLLLIAVILFINYATYHLALLKEKYQNKKPVQFAKNAVSNFHLPFESFSIQKNILKNTGSHKFFLCRYKEFKKLFLELGYSQRQIDSIRKIADKFIKQGNLTYLKIINLINFKSYMNNYYNKGYKDGKRFWLPDSLKHKLAAIILIDSSDSKDTCGYFNAHQAFLLQSWNEAITIGLFKGEHCRNFYFYKIMEVLLELEKYLYNPVYKQHKDKEENLRNNEIQKCSMEKGVKGGTE